MDVLKNLRTVVDGIPSDAYERLVAAVNRHERIFVYGAGRSGLMLKAFAMRLAQAGRTVYVVGETVTPAITDRDILVLASASGGTPSVVRCAETARKVGATVFAIVSKRDSALFSVADESVEISAPSKDDGATVSLMGTLFEEALLLFCDGVISQLGEDAAAMRARHANLE